MDFRESTQGKNSTKAVEQVVLMYDNAVAIKDGQVAAQYVEVWGHPDSKIGKGQTNLALVTQRTERNGKPAFNHTIPLYPGQVEAIRKTAGDNTVPLLDSQGKKVGMIFGVKSDLMQVQRDGRTVGFMPNTKTLAPSELSVKEVDGKSIRDRIFESMAEAKAQRQAEAKTQDAPAQSAPAKEAEAEIVHEQSEPELV